MQCSPENALTEEQLTRYCSRMKEYLGAPNQRQIFAPSVSVLSFGADSCSISLDILQGTDQALQIQSALPVIQINADTPMWLLLRAGQPG
jgi:hypothetical protein